MSIKPISLDTFTYKTGDSEPRERVIYLTEETPRLIKGVDAETGNWRSFNKVKVLNRISRPVEFPGEFIF